MPSTKSLTAEWQGQNDNRPADHNQGEPSLEDKEDFSRAMSINVKNLFGQFAVHRRGHNNNESMEPVYHDEVREVFTAEELNIITKLLRPYIVRKQIDKPFSVGCGIDASIEVDRCLGRVRFSNRTLILRKDVHTDSNTYSILINTAQIYKTSFFQSAVQQFERQLQKNILRSHLKSVPNRKL